MDRRSRISIVTACVGPAGHLAETVESVVGQDYASLEHIVVTRHRGDDMPAALARHPQVKLVSDPCRNRESALNAGARVATGDVHGILDEGESLLAGALDRVAREIDPARGRHVVMGRCQLRDERGHPVGIEQPSDCESHRRVLEIWRGHTIPRAAVFWTPEVWRACGPIDESAGSWADYDLCCRLSRSYRLHRVDQVLAATRLAANARSTPWTDADHVEAGIAWSRRYWGSPLRPLHWRLALSLGRYRFDRVGRARRHVRWAREHRRPGGDARAVLAHAAAAVLLAPNVALYAGAYPALRARVTRLRRKVLAHGAQGDRPSWAIRGPLEQTGAWRDGWVGPRLAVTCEIARHAQAVEVAGSADLQYITQPLVLTVHLNGDVIGRHRVLEPGEFLVRIPIMPSLPPGVHTVDVEASTWFVPDSHTGSGDLRPLAWRLRRVELDAVANG